MNRATVVSIRTHLVTASIAAMAIDAIVVVAIDLLGIRESAFETPGFRLAVVIRSAAMVERTQGS